jgi:threonine synthase
MSFALCDIIKKNTKETITTPTIDIKIPINNTKLEKSVKSPADSLPPTTDEMPMPISLLKRRRNMVAATHNVILATITLV